MVVIGPRVFHDMSALTWTLRAVGIGLSCESVGVRKHNNRHEELNH